MNWKVIVGRRKRLLRYFRAVPTKLVDLAQFGFSVLEKGGIKANVACECKAVGCLAGWAQTSPEFRRWATRNKVRLGGASDSLRQANKTLAALNVFLGIGDGPTCGWLFDGPEDHGATQKSQKEEAMNRLRRLVREGKEHVTYS